MAAHSYGTTSSIADAVGTLIMPYGTVENVLRVTTTSHDSDTFLGSGYINYFIQRQDYYKVGVPRPLVTFFDQVGGGTAVSGNLNGNYGSWLADPALVVREAVSNTIGMDLLPNPAHNRATLVFSSQGGPMELALIDATGRTVHSMKLDRQPMGIAKQELDLAGLPPGLYTIQLAAANGQRGMKKLVVE
ncbi:MAG: T9SS type A sorting domain-containing protein [Acidobacteria bacterium]|nr:T9SS type A sorting domain-containing protein [Acidobacteriota bacterium]